MWILRQSQETWGFEYEVSSVEISLQLCTPTSSCNQHTGGGTFSREVRTLLTLRQLEVSSGKWDTHNSLTASGSQVSPGAPTPWNAITLWGKSRSGTGSSILNLTCAFKTPITAPLPAFWVPQIPRGESKGRGAKTQKIREEEEEGGGRQGRQPSKAKVPKWCN